MSLQNGIVGSRFRGQRITWKLNDYTRPDLRTATITGKRRLIATQESFTITGILTPDPDVQDVFTWQYSAEDVSRAGLYEVQFSALYPNGYSEHSLPEKWTVFEQL
jgi:hypothetical protein